MTVGSVFYAVLLGCFWKKILTTMQVTMTDDGIIESQNI